jgi:hypothetical protein
LVSFEFDLREIDARFSQLPGWGVVDQPQEVVTPHHAVVASITATPDEQLRNEFVFLKFEQNRAIGKDIFFRRENELLQINVMATCGPDVAAGQCKNARSTVTVLSQIYLNF